jgi:hypothetical protein
MTETSGHYASPTLTAAEADFSDLIHEKDRDAADGFKDGSHE